MQREWGTRRRGYQIMVVGHGRRGFDLLRTVQDRRAAIAAATGLPVELSGVHSRPAAGRIDRRVLSSALRMIDMVRPDVVVEAVGLLEPAVDIAERAMRAGASVVTASPELVGVAGPRLAALAADRRALFVEAALGFGIPIGRLLRQSSGAAAPRRVVAFPERPADRGNGGRRPTDPRGGTRVARHWIAALASTAFDARTTTADVVVDDVASGADSAVERYGSIRLLSACERVGDGVAARVYPALVPDSHPFGGPVTGAGGLLVELAPTDTMLVWRRGSALARASTAMIRDLVAAARLQAARPPARDPNPPLAAPWVNPAAGGDLTGHFLIVADGLTSAGDRALVHRLAARGVAARASRLDQASGQARIVTERIAESVLRRVLADIEVAGDAGGITLAGTLRIELTPWCDPAGLLR